MTIDDQIKDGKIQNDTNREAAKTSALSSGDTVLPEMHLKQPECTYRASGTFTKNKK